MKKMTHGYKIKGTRQEKMKREWCLRDIYGKVRRASSVGGHGH